MSVNHLDSFVEFIKGVHWKRFESNIYASLLQRTNITAAAHCRGQSIRLVTKKGTSWLHPPTPTDAWCDLGLAYDNSKLVVENEMYCEELRMIWTNWVRHKFVADLQQSFCLYRSPLSFLCGIFIFLFLYTSNWHLVCKVSFNCQIFILIKNPAPIFIHFIWSV